MKTMYPGMPNSPTTELAAAITASQTTATVLNGAVLPDAPNLAVIGGEGELAETILYTSKSGNTLSGITRGLQGSARAWSAGTGISRNFTEVDYAAMIENIKKNNEGIGTVSSALTTHTADTAAHGATSDATPNRIVTRDANGQFKVGAPTDAAHVARKGDIDAPPFTTTTGTSTAYVATYNPAYTALVAGTRITIKTHIASGASPTINVNGLGAKSMRNNEGDVFAAGDLEAGRIYTFIYDGTNFTQVSGGGDEVRIDFIDHYFYDEKKFIANTTDVSRRGGLAGATVGNYALFAGGNTGSARTNKVDAYETNLTRTAPTEMLFSATSELAGASVGNYALFAGGYSGSSSASTTTAYNNNLVRTQPTRLSDTRHQLAGASVGNYALFAGGTNSNNLNIVDAYDTNLTRTTVTALSQARYSITGVSFNGQALFAGGWVSSASNVIDAYNVNLTRTTPTALSQARHSLGGASVGNYVLFAGGTGSNNFNIVDAYDTNLTRTTTTALSQARYALAGASVNGQALFAGGVSGSASNVIDAYNVNLVRTVPLILSQARFSIAATTIDGNAMFAGGSITGFESYSDVVDSIQYDYPLAEQWITEGSKYNFGEGERVATTNKITLRSPANGYIKFKKGVIS